MDRGTRRHRTNRIIARRLALHLLFDHTPWNRVLELEGRFTCNYCDHSPRFLDTHRPCSCGCSKRQHGRPGVASGMCCCDDRKRVYKWRKEARELNRLVTQGWEGDSDLVANAVL